MIGKVTVLLAVAFFSLSTAIHHNTVTLTRTVPNDDKVIRRLYQRGKELMHECGPLPPPSKEDMEFEKEIYRLRNMVRKCAIKERIKARNWHSSLSSRTISEYLHYLEWQDRYLTRIMNRIERKLNDNITPSSSQKIYRHRIQIIQKGLGRRKIRRRVIRRKIRVKRVVRQSGNVAYGGSTSSRTVGSSSSSSGGGSTAQTITVQRRVVQNQY